MENLFDIIRQCVLKGIPVEITHEPEKAIDGIGYRVSGFAKSGVATLVQTEGGIVAHTRYNQENKIESFDDLASIAFEWCDGYIDRGYSYGEWMGVFEEKGWIKRKVETVTTWVKD